jgi:GNAT superfamily N-acetyltransferase
MQPVTTEFEGYTITTDKSLMNIYDVHQWLSESSYWCPGIPFDTFSTAFSNSFCIGAMLGTQQVAYAALVTDYATYAYLKDVFVLEEHRGRCLGKQMLQILFDLDWVRSLRVIKLATRDAHTLYGRYGFLPAKYPDRVMEIVRSRPSDNIPQTTTQKSINS